jgi:transposase
MADLNFTTASPEQWRELRGRQLAKQMAGKIRKCGQRWLVPSSAGGAGYLVDPIEAKCTCPDHELHGAKCKHLHAVEYLLIWAQTEAPSGTVTEAPVMRRKTYAQPSWPAYHAAQVHEKEHVEQLLRALCEGIVTPPQTMGRPRIPLRDVVYACVHKVYTTVSGRRAQSDLRACATRGQVEVAASYNSVFRYMESPALTAILTAMIEEAALPLRDFERQFAQDSTGFGTTTYRRWFDEKYGEKSEQVWVKLHAFIGTNTNVITSARVTDSGDSPMLAPLLGATVAKGFRVAEVSADKAYLSHANVETIVAAGARPYIPFKENTTGKGPELWRHLYAFYMVNRPVFLAHYHRRSNVESTFSMIKAKFGASVRSKLPVAQVNEVLAKCLCHNLACLVSSMYETGLKPQFWNEAPAGAEVH